MQTMPVYIKKLKAQAAMPSYGSAEAAGADLYACLETAVEIATGLAMELPEGTVGLVYARSGLASKKGLAPANKVGVIDSDYRGEVMVALHNHSAQAAVVEPGERIAQLVVAPVLRAAFAEADALSDTVRGEGGFGSTGRK